VDGRVRILEPQKGFPLANSGARGCGALAESLEWRRGAAPPPSLQRQVSSLGFSRGRGMADQIFRALRTLGMAFFSR